MSYNLSNDAEPPPAPNPPGISASNLRLFKRAGTVLALIVFVVLVLWWARAVYTDWLWFEHLGYRGVFTKILILKVWLFLAGTLVAGLSLTVSLILGFRYSKGPSTLSLSDESNRLIWALLAVGAGMTVVIASLVFGSVAQGRWETVLLYFNQIPFGVTDSQFGLDAAFYVATLRLLHFIQGWFLGLAVALIVAALSLYVAVYSLRGIGLLPSPLMFKHIAVLGVFLMLAIAAGHALQLYELVLSDSGVVFGATYTDVHARMPALWLLTGIATLSALGFAVSIYHAGVRLMTGSFSLWVIAVLLAGLAYPMLFQRFQVEPNEFELEQVYIQRNIEATRWAYGLDQMQETIFRASPKLSAKAVDDSQSILDNIRLWDLQPLQDAYNQLQFMELYYNFLNIDWDRYPVNGEMRQVLVAARELNQDNLPPDAQNWVNQRLQYTHGYGLVMSPATEFTPGEGRPEFLLHDIPIKGEYPVERPGLYYGETTNGFAIVNSALPEVGPGGEPQHYGGNGGVSLNSFLRRISYASQFGDINILLSSQVTPESRIQYRREIHSRVKAVAPFLKLDLDPYPVLDQAGKLWWLQDAYTATDRIPYAAPTARPLPRAENREILGGFNYIRNSVKVVVDAYNGSVDYYVIQPNDPLVQMYRKAFPGLLKDFDQMPQDLQNHIRYPIGLFTAQTQMYLRYHVTDPQVFFNQAEQWAVPLESRFGKRGVLLRPTYLMIQVPGEEGVEFVLMLPFTPAGEKKNLVGWIIARNDRPNYGGLIAFQVPGDPQVDGPSQVEARIENDQQISQQFTLWEGAGSRVIRGQLLVIPMADTILYVEPMYLQSEVLAFPELKKIILADGSDVVMADTIKDGLIMLVDGGKTPPLADSVPGTGTEYDPNDFEQIREAVSGLEDALDGLRKALKDLKDASSGNTGR
mgnify:CR=1 FL=1